MSDPKLVLWSEPFKPSGGVAASGVKNALGRPRMDLPTLLIRETVQNSWDAKDSDTEGPVKFSVDGFKLEGESARVLRTRVLPGYPGKGLNLDVVLKHDRIPVLVLSDRGTTGLGGPTRADTWSERHHDFVDFVRNVGQPPDKQRGGGTYGYGKAVLYMASAASTIVVYTRCAGDKDDESRLIAIALGEPHRVGNRPFTGRHWWGVEDSDVGVEPLTGSKADRLAVEIGMPGFGQSERGTSIMIVGAPFGDGGMRTAMGEMKNALLWHCWPKMLDSGRGPEMVFSIRCDGEDLPLDHPSSHPKLRGFVAAYDLATGGKPGAVIASHKTTVSCQKPPQELGSLAIVKLRCPDGVYMSSGEDGSGEPFSDAPHHVALLRAPKLVVAYRPGPELPVPGTVWAGVFIASDETDRAFAKSEPPSHDDWVPDVLPKSREKTFVNVALSRIREFVKSCVHVPVGSDGISPAQPLAGVAGALGGLLAPVEGPGTRTLLGGGKKKLASGGTKRGRGGALGRATIEIGPTRLLIFDGTPALEVRFRVTPDRQADSTILTAAPSVLINDGAAAERETPVGASAPSVLWWELDGRKTSETQCVTRGSKPQDGIVMVRLPDDTSVAVSIGASSRQDGSSTG